MKNLKTNAGSFAAAKLKAVRRAAVIITITMTTVIALSFAACELDDIGVGGGNGGDGDSGLIGKWYVTQETADSLTEEAVCYEFKANGELLAANLEYGFTYKASGGKLTLYVYGFTTGDSADYSISGTELTISNEGDSGFADGTYYKPR
jgi:hypothetical protein